MEQAGPVLTDTRFLLLLIAVAWSGLLALARRAVAGLEAKIDENARKAAELQSQMATMIGDTKYRIERNFRDLVEDSRQDVKELSERIAKLAAARSAETGRLRLERMDRINDVQRRMADRLEEMQKKAVSHHEFRLFVANMNAKVEAVYNLMMKTE